MILVLNGSGSRRFRGVPVLSGSGSWRFLVLLVLSVSVPAFRFGSYVFLQHCRSRVELVVERWKDDVRATKSYGPARLHLPHVDI